MEGFARALRQMPATIADNGGLDSAELVTQLRAAHHAVCLWLSNFLLLSSLSLSLSLDLLLCSLQGDATAGIDILSGKIGNMRKLGITEPLKLKMQVLLSAAEAAEMILRVDDIIKCAPRQRQH